MSKAYGYGRHSTNKQGMTEGEQKRVCEEYYTRKLKPKGVEWAGFFYDRAVSGKTIFSEREYGRQVYFSLVKGDTLIVAATDRLFRNKVDGFVTLDQLDKKGVKRVILDLPDLSGLDGDEELYDMLESNMVLYGHMYRRMASRKMKLDIQAKKEAGVPFSFASPVGWKVFGDRKNKSYRVNPLEREVVATMAGMHANGDSLETIALWWIHQEYVSAYGDKKCRRFTTYKSVSWAIWAHHAGYPKTVTSYRDYSLARLR